MLRSIALLLLLCQVATAQDELGGQNLFEPTPAQRLDHDEPAAFEAPPAQPVIKKEDWKPKLAITLTTSPNGHSMTQHRVRRVPVLETAYEVAEMHRDGKEVKVNVPIQKRSWREVTETISVAGSNQLLCDDFKLGMEATDTGTNYSFESTGRLILQRQGSSIEAESGSYSNGKLRLLNAKVQLAGMSMEADTLVISMRVFGVSTVPTADLQPRTGDDRNRVLRPQPDGAFTNREFRQSPPKEDGFDRFDLKVIE
ncbi:MAG: hypothetical protein ABJZ55_22960 [Fuerstiella sp.]